MQININGIYHDYDRDTIAYDDLEAMVAIEERRQPPVPLLSITYSWKGDDDASRSGIISPKSKPVKVEDGMRFSAYNTGNA